ncbi:hypothetical protein [uncultured Corynebacterium sp.]|uniref:hypothetical protein n=1 Tax=uncultured Corynebacterium sp. TaxID=159447 RepID=UPI0028D66F4C|nr:hypothetical protein [uncultured Corynebacterium sp.]
MNFENKPIMLCEGHDGLQLVEETSSKHYSSALLFSSELLELNFDDSESGLGITTFCRTMPVSGATADACAVWVPFSVILQSKATVTVVPGSAFKP